MSTYVIMMKLTEHGAQHIKSAPARIEETVRAFEAVGGKVSSFYAVTGEYDFACVVDSPNDEIVMAFSMGLGTAGNVTTTTLKAFTKKQFYKAIRQLDRLELLAERSEAEALLY
jgi:uncharacterized protein with GYD domain